MVVDDDSSIRSLASAVLTRQGFSVLEADDGRCALSLLKRGRQCVDLVVTDIVMPGGVDGVAVAEAFMRQCPATRVILMSGYFGGATLNCESHERWIFMPKPFQSINLIQAVLTVGAISQKPLKTRTAGQ